jgi:hypothetical protein
MMEFHVFLAVIVSIPYGHRQEVGRENFIRASNTIFIVRYYTCSSDHASCIAYHALPVLLCTLTHT